MGRRNARKKADIATRETNFADVAIRFIDALYDLAQTGNLIGLVVIGVVCWIFLVTYKLPPESIDKILGNIGLFLTTEKFYFFPLSLTITISLSANFIQAKVYRQHIKYLTEHRKKLVHGLDDGDLKVLTTHHTTDFNIEDDKVNCDDGD